MRLRVLCVVFLLWCGLAEASPQCGSKFDGPPNFVVHSVRFIGLNSVSPDEREKITKSVIGICFDNGEELSQLIRDILQQRGFFKAVVSEPKLDVKKRRRGPSPVGVDAEIELGRKYSLEDVGFTGAKAFPASQLRPLIPMTAGDVFNIDKIRQGLKTLRDLYGDYGYINFTPVPDTQFDDDRGTIRLTIDLDEGGQFRVGKVLILAPQSVADRLYAAWPLKPGAIYNGKGLEQFFAENKALLPRGWAPEKHFEISVDTQAKTVTLRLSLCPPDQFCPQGYREY